MGVDFMTKKDDKLLTPGNIILGVIIIALIGSLFFDFFGGAKIESIGCPQAIPNLIVSNIVYGTESGKIFDMNRDVKAEHNSSEQYFISALLRNTGNKEIKITQTALTPLNLGPLELTKIDEIVVEPNSLKTIKLAIPRGDYHKIDLYSDDVCEGTVIWHDMVGHEIYEQEQAGEELTVNETA